MMASRERWLAAVEMQPVDRLPFWPKIGPAYAVAQTRSLTVPEWHAWFGSDRHEWVSACVMENRRTTKLESQTTGDLRRTTYIAPAGRLEQVYQNDPVAGGLHPVKFPVQTREDVKVMTAIWEDVTVAVDRKAVTNPPAGADAKPLGKAIYQFS